MIPYVRAISEVDYFELQNYAEQFLGNIDITDLLGDGIGNGTTHSCQASDNIYNYKDMDYTETLSLLLATLMAELPEGTPDNFAVWVSW